jgi:hypothetical protein
MGLSVKVFVRLPEQLKRNSDLIPRLFLEKEEIGLVGISLKYKCVRDWGLKFVMDWVRRRIIVVHIEESRF